MEEYAEPYNSKPSTTAAPSARNLGTGTGLLARLKESIDSIAYVTDEAAQFHLVQQLLLQLPLAPRPDQGTGIYRELNTLSNLNDFQIYLDQIKNILLRLEKKMACKRTRSIHECHASMCHVPTRGHLFRYMHP